ncbi:hypothetical protein, partial [uncultured Helicobacter sp.]
PFSYVSSLFLIFVPLSLSHLLQSLIYYKILLWASKLPFALKLTLYGGARGISLNRGVGNKSWNAL